jgi:aminoglycoside phosphotransferase (APT) family kinase protein
MGRLSWEDVPAVLRDNVEALLGGEIVEARSQASGWSPGSADRVVTAGGSRAFVKTLSRSRNADGYAMHRREASVMRALPAGIQAPRLLGAVDVTVDGDDWTAVVLTDVDGRHPVGDEDTTAVLDALDTLPLANGALAALPRAAVDLDEEFGAWSRMLANGLPDIVTEPIRVRATTLAELERDAASLVDGEHLVHLDCRADNLIVDPLGDVWVIDWPWAAVGAHWLDPLTYLVDVLVRGEQIDPDRHVASHPVFASVVPSTVDAVLAALAGMFFEKAAQPAPPGMPGLREFQRREAIACADWVLRRGS